METYRPNLAILHGHECCKATTGSINFNGVYTFLYIYPVHEHRQFGNRYGSMATHGTVAFIVQKEDTKIGFVIIRLYQQATVHISVSSGLVHERLTQMIVVLLAVAPLR